MESPHATSYVPIIVTWLVSFTVPEMWRIIGPTFAVDMSLTPKFRMAEFGLKKIKTPLYRAVQKVFGPFWRDS